MLKPVYTSYSQVRLKSNGNLKVYVIYFATVIVSSSVIICPYLSSVVISFFTKMETDICDKASLLDLLRVGEVQKVFFRKCTYRVQIQSPNSDDFEFE